MFTKIVLRTTLTRQSASSYIDATLLITHVVVRYDNDPYDYIDTSPALHLFTPVCNLTGLSSRRQLETNICGCCFGLFRGS